MSEGYKTKVSCLGGIRSIGCNAPEAVLDPGGAVTVCLGGIEYGYGGEK